MHFILAINVRNNYESCYPQTYGTTTLKFLEEFMCFGPAPKIILRAFSQHKQIALLNCHKICQDIEPTLQFFLMCEQKVKMQYTSGTSF